MTEHIRTLSSCNWISKNSNTSKAKKKSAATAVSRSVVRSRSRAFAAHSVTVRPTTMNWMTSRASGSMPFGAGSWKTHDDVIKWKYFPRYCPFGWGIHRLPVNSPHKSQWRGALMFSLIYAWINDQVNNRDAGDLRRHRAHYDVIVMNKGGYHVVFSDVSNPNSEHVDGMIWRRFPHYKSLWGESASHARGVFFHVILNKLMGN